MATVDELRLKILDRPQVVIGERVGTGDGSRMVYRISHAPIMSGSVTILVGGEKQTEGENYTLDYSNGKLSFSLAPSGTEPIVADYEFAAFSDDELQEFLDKAGGNLALAAGEALTSLMADRNRMITWSRGDAKLDYDRLRQDLADVARRFYSRGASESGSVAEDVDWEGVE
jgi:hypothetical protein